MPTVVSFPAITPNSSTSRIITNTRQFISPLSGYTQTASRIGARWLLTLEFRNLSSSSRAVLMGYLAFQEGQVNRIGIGDPSYTGARGALGVSVEVDGASQSGTTLDIREVSSGTSSISNFLRAGDQISYSNGTYNELKMVTSDTNLSSGSATVPIFPEIHGPPADGAAIETSSPVGTFMLAQPIIQWSNRPGVFSDFTIELLEDIGT